MELKDTIEMMCSEDYKERFKAEYYQTKIRYEKLSNMVNKWEDGKLEFEPTVDRSTLKMQLRSMEAYLMLLEKRAEIEGVEL